MNDNNDIEKLLADGQIDDNLISDLYSEIVEFDEFIAASPASCGSPTYCGPGVYNTCYSGPGGKGCICKC